MADEETLQVTEGSAEVSSPADTGAAPDTPVSDAAPEPSKPEKLSLRDEIKKNIKDVQDPDRKPVTVKVGERLKDPSTGKFVAKAGDAPKAAAPAPETPATEKDAQPVAVSTPAGPPPGWSKESKALFNALPDPIKQDILKREQEVSNGFKQYADKSKRYDELEQIIGPRRATLSQLGVRSDAHAINALFAWEEYVRSQPERAILQLAQERGIDLNQLASRLSEQPSNAAPDATAQIRPVLDQFGQKFQSLESELQQIRQEKIGSELATFAKTHPHFEKVRVKMGQLIQAGLVPPTDLETAYQEAVWANPEVRGLLQTEQVNAALKEKQAAFENSRKAAISIGTRAPSAPVINGNGKEKPKGVRDSILASMREVSERTRA